MKTFWLKKYRLWLPADGKLYITKNFISKGGKLSIIMDIMDESQSEYFKLTNNWIKTTVLLAINFTTILNHEKNVQPLPLVKATRSESGVSDTTAIPNIVFTFIILFHRIISDFLGVADGIIVLKPVDVFAE